MTVGAFLDPERRPTVPDLASAVGPDGGRFRRLVSWMQETYGLDGELVWVDAEDGWCLRYRRSGRSLLTLRPRPGALAALVVVGPTAWAAVQELALSPEVRGAWDAARPYPDGRWLWLRIDGDHVAGDVERLIVAKSPPPRRVRAVTAR